MEVWLKCDKNHKWKRNLSHLFRTIKGVKKIMKCPECYKPTFNGKSIQFNGVQYNSISDCCRKLNIDRNILYRSKVIDVQKQIE